MLVLRFGSGQPVVGFTVMTMVMVPPMTLTPAEFLMFHTAECPFAPQVGEEGVRINTEISEVAPGTV